MHVGKIFKKSIIFILLFLLNFSLNAEIFRFKFKKGSKQKIIAKFIGEQYQNSQLIAKYLQSYKTIRLIKDIENEIGVIEDTHYYYNQNTYYNNQVYQVEDITTSYYKKNITGNMAVNENSKYPTYRNVPVFPEYEIKPGTTWTANAVEIQDLFNDNTISRFPVLVKYTFIGYEELDGVKLAKFEYEHTLDITNSYRYQIDPRIIRVVGKSKTIMYFDNVNGTRVKEKYLRHYQFLVEKNNTRFVAELVDDGERIWSPVELMDKEKTLEDIKKKLKDEKIEDTEVEKDDKGIKLSLENIHFYPDSSQLLPGEYDRIKKIASILKTYKDRGIMLIGHTTNRGTAEGRKKLSIERAKVVMDLLIELDAINVNKSTFGGKGGDEPVADNNSEEGMKKNRRVEIYILEE